jgi:N-acetylglucosamine malate deacetylase 2
MAVTLSIHKLIIPAFLVAVFAAITLPCIAQQTPRALVVIAHPDDESILSVSLYKFAKEQHGTVDLFVITNGEAGYRYSTLAEQYYNCPLTDAANARKNLPAIRKKELHEAGNILGISHYYFGNQQDSHYGLNEHEPLDTSWDVVSVKKQLNGLLTSNRYDYVFCLLPEAGTHAAHKAATLLALDAVAALPEAKRPIILGAALRNKSEEVVKFTALGDYTQTQTIAAKPSFAIDRTVSFSFHDRINYKIIANWELAAHKSQGATQMTMNDGDLEEFWYFKINGEANEAKATALFSKLGLSPYFDNNNKQVQQGNLTALLH